MLIKVEEKRKYNNVMKGLLKVVPQTLTGIVLTPISFELRNLTY